LHDALSCKIVVEYYPGEEVKNGLLKNKQLGGTASWPSAQAKQVNSADLFHNLFHLLDGV